MPVLVYYNYDDDDDDDNNDNDLLVITVCALQGEFFVRNQYILLLMGFPGCPDDRGTTVFQNNVKI